MDTQKEDSVKTWINEETLLLAQYLRNEKETWKPRIVLYMLPSENRG
jgi:hypothetical protein